MCQDEPTPWFPITRSRKACFPRAREGHFPTRTKQRVPGGRRNFSEQIPRPAQRFSGTAGGSEAERVRRNQSGRRQAGREDRPSGKTSPWQAKLAASPGSKRWGSSNAGNCPRTERWGERYRRDRGNGNVASCPSASPPHSGTRQLHARDFSGNASSLL